MASPVADRTVGNVRATPHQIGTDPLVGEAVNALVDAGAAHHRCRGGTARLHTDAADRATTANVADGTFELVRRQVDVRGSYRFANTYPTAISLIADGDVDAAKITDFNLPLDRVSDAFERATEPDVVKSMISMG